MRQITTVLLLVYFFLATAEAKKLSSLSWLVYKGDTDGINTYLAQHPGIDLTAIDDDECPPVLFAIETSPVTSAWPIKMRWDLLKLLLKSGADINQQCGKDHDIYDNNPYAPWGYSILAVLMQYPQIFSDVDVKTLLSLGANIRELNAKNGYNLWHSLLTVREAKDQADPKMLQSHPNTIKKADLLIQNRIDPNKKGSEGCFTSGMGLIASSLFLSKLIEGGLDLAITCGKHGGLFDLRYWGPSDDTLEIAQMMVANGANINAVSEGQSVFWEAIDDW